MEENRPHNSLIVIGSGPGGYVAALEAAKAGFDVKVVESASLGGVCLNWGCIPTKALLKSVQTMNHALEGAAYGFTAENVQPDIERIFARSREVAATMSKGIEFLFKKAGVQLIQGSGRILPGKQVEVTAADGSVSVLEAEHTIIATGARPTSLPFAPVDGEKIWCSRQALMPPFIPASMAVIGSGAVGTEFAYFYRCLGVEVTIIEFMDRVLPLEDDDISGQVSRNLRKMGIKVMTSSAVQAVEKGEKCILTVNTKKGEEKVEAEVVLSAVGVVPNTDFIGLEQVGVEMNRRKIVVDSSYRTNVEGIYAIGDVISTPALAHVASAEAIACVEGIAGHEHKPVNYETIPACTYISPEVASAGLREREVIAKGIEYRVGKCQFAANGKAVAAGEKDGFVKLICDANDGRLLGVHLVGANVSEMIGGMVLALDNGVTADQLSHTVFPHPTMSEAICEACRQLTAK
ncbi:MAG: dihydrolipoyl dehydrogenase [Bacteroidales bacterium]|nr:dihydrolipoyl dehydrogenase [Bacteroidales bacterium]